MRGILFDQPQVVTGATELLARAGVADRCDVVGGDFFESVPRGADAYLLKSVIHDWDDKQAVEILRTCRSAMTAGAKLRLVKYSVRQHGGRGAGAARRPPDDLRSGHDPASHRARGVAGLALPGSRGRRRLHRRLAI